MNYTKYKKVKIYYLICPITLEIKYVGQTVLELHIRFRSHVHNSKVNKSLKDKWILELIDQGKLPIIELVEEVDFLEGNYWEKYYYNMHKDKLLNTRDLSKHKVDCRLVFKEKFQFN